MFHAFLSRFRHPHLCIQLMISSLWETGVIRDGTACLHLIHWLVCASAHRLSTSPCFYRETFLLLCRADSCTWALDPMPLNLHVNISLAISPSFWFSVLISLELLAAFGIIDQSILLWNALCIWFWENEALWLFSLMPKPSPLNTFYWYFLNCHACPHSVGNPLQLFASNWYLNVNDFQTDPFSANLPLISRLNLHLAFFLGWLEVVHTEYIQKWNLDILSTKFTLSELLHLSR